MPLPPFLQRKKTVPSAAPAAPPVNDDSGPVQAARIRARRRLLGAVVLLAAGIIGFPLIFETAPRPMNPDLRIDTAAGSRDTAVASAGAAASPAPPASLPAADRDAGAPPPAARRLPPLPDERSAAEAVADAAPAATSTAGAAAAAATAAAASAGRSAPVTAPPMAATPSVDDGARAKALLDGADAAAAQASQAKASRYIVQVGAYSDGNALRDARQKVEKLGLKTYTQVVDGDGGQRTRVRVGPFTTRDEADRAGARLRSAGLPVAVLVL